LTLQQFADISLRQGLSVIRTLLHEQTEGDLAELHARRDALYTELLKTEPISVPGIEEQLAILRQTCRMAIVTSCRTEHFAVIHDRINLLQFFDLVLTREDYRAGKPSPEPYLAASRRSGDTPADCLAIEDSPRGQQAAIAAGLDCIIIPNRFLATTDFAPISQQVPNIRHLAERILSRKA
jgi:HAD superfamily hydrolase (TIGR01509 family)